MRAYQWGLFPMGENRDDPTIYWVDPEVRGILPLDGFHMPRRLARSLRRAPFDITVDRAYGAVIDACGEAAPRRQTTWINGRIVELYNDLFDMGYAHSVECWRDGKLVGGLYGVAIGGAFFGESMFSRASDASKAALAHLVARLRHGGYALLDTQFVTDHLAQFGTVEVARGKYLQLLARALRRKGDFYSLDASPGESGGESDGVSAGIGSTK